ncbi:MAG TPA: START domain-containing protein [Bacteroidia bacterium]|jgi:ribosome-associated toxin RatA of RatAB toxin-antitoxin module
MLLLLVWSFTPLKINAPQDWQLKKFENGISVYTRSLEASKFKELRAVFEIKTSLSSIIALLNDVETYPQWVYRCQASKILKKKSDQNLIRYQSILAPWPVDNRDMVVEVHTYQEDKTGIVYQKVTCLPDYSPVIPGHVRIREFRAVWKLSPLKNGMVKVEYELLVNPGGNIPAWIINMAVVDGPYDTSLKMKDWIMKEKYQKASYPFIKEPS